MKQTSLINIFESKRKAEEFDPSSTYQRLALQNKKAKQNQPSPKPSVKQEKVLIDLNKNETVLMKEFVSNPNESIFIININHLSSS